MEEFWGIDREDGEILPEGFDERARLGGSG